MGKKFDRAMENFLNIDTSQFDIDNNGDDILDRMISDDDTDTAETTEQQETDNEDYIEN